MISRVKHEIIFQLLFKQSRTQSRQFSTAIQSFKSNDIELSKATQLKPQLDLKSEKDYHFGSHYTDHMFVVEFDRAKGWAKPQIKPYGPLKIPTSGTALHYGISCHEGTSICANKITGKLQGFRLDQTTTDFLKVNDYLDLPAFDKGELIDCVKALVKADSHWMPQDNNHYLYLRLNHFSTDRTLGVKVANNSMLTGILTPVPFHHHELRGQCSFAKHRNWPLGHASMRLAGNFGPLIPTLSETKKSEQNSVIWMVDDYIKELTTMNVFMLIKSRYGELELLTPPADGTVYNGSMRRTIVQLAHQLSQGHGFKVVEREVSIGELIHANEEERLEEMFGFSFENDFGHFTEVVAHEQKIKITKEPIIGKALYKELNDIRTGEDIHEWVQTLE